MTDIATHGTDIAGVVLPLDTVAEMYGAHRSPDGGWVFAAAAAPRTAATLTLGGHDLGRWILATVEARSDRDGTWYEATLHRVTEPGGTP